ncbi:hypothetical protein J2785_004464 [Burkholderia ambifaria]|uniref:Uncharacterized protein n=1 Tax=Burkholderia pyrrocinia TaxID=60550 RepID=A0A318IN44_BURPY|nr:hypothetical protein [Burkholderia ambifaria]PXX29591.1 hypothetical protein NA66_1016128 [Burkholderia pyrrocinia]SFW71559.1 hypothetical protein SAMN03159384_04139 [Burkholderia sp. NFACC33-1]SFY34703.1 hypothetical protein SAMN03159408_04352 [Burkholderia sp. NFPP32]
MKTATFPPVHVEPQRLAATTRDHMASNDKKSCWNGSYWKTWRFQWPITTDNIHYARS